MRRCRRLRFVSLLHLSANLPAKAPVHKSYLPWDLCHLDIRAWIESLVVVLSWKTLIDFCASVVEVSDYWRGICSACGWWAWGLSSSRSSRWRVVSVGAISQDTETSN